MGRTDLIVIGAGVIGLAIAAKLAGSKKDVIVLERNDGFGRETSSRNSEVIHAGLYYPEGSLKSSLCVRGNHLLRGLCLHNAIRHQILGKLVIANSEDDEKQLEIILQRCRKLELSGVERLDRATAQRLEPNMRCSEALLSRNTGILDSHQLMAYWENEAKRNGAVFGYNCNVAKIDRRTSGLSLEIMDMNEKQTVSLESDFVVNAAGLAADDVATRAGLDSARLGYRIHYCKGEYFSISNRHKDAIQHLIYPAPTQYGLGIHFTKNLGGQLRLGPNDFYVNSLDYSVDPSHRSDFFASAKEYLPFLEKDDLSPDISGIRPKLQAEGEGFRDFVIQEETKNGVPGLINLLGMESPGLTAAPAIAEYVENLIARL